MEIGGAGGNAGTGADPAGSGAWGGCPYVGGP